MITKKLSVEKKESNLESSQRIQVSQEEIAKRRNIQRLVLGSIAVDNSPINPDTRYIFNDFVEGRIATIEEAKAKLMGYYSQNKDEW